MIKNTNIDGGNAFDWGFTSEQYSKYRDIYPSRLYERLKELGVARDNTAWLDLGTGTGILPRNLYNPKTAITGVDISKEQIKYARLTAKKNGCNITYIVSPAENTSLPSHSFDCVTAAQCFAYFDREKIKQEIKRLLKREGKFISIYMDWCADGEICSKSIALTEKYNKSWKAKIAPDELTADLFDKGVTESFLCDIPFTRESWHGRMCACRGTLASMSEEQFEKWEAEHIKMLSAYPEEFTVKHKIYITYFKM